MSASPVRAVVVGASGYSGAELVRILLAHPHAALAGLFGSAKRADGPVRFDELFPRFRGRTSLDLLPAEPAAITALKPDVAFLATPHAVSHDLAPALLDAGVRVFDLSAAFRLRDPAAYPKHYAFTHARPDLLARAVYGLAEFARDALPESRLVAVPGCYPTSAILPLRPLLRAGALDPARRPIVDSTSGVSGAGRSPELRSLFCEVSQQPYAVFAHRHTPEISEHAGAPVIFTPHLGPYDRGIVSTIHAELAPGWTFDRVHELMLLAFGRERFVRLLPKGAWPSAAGVRGTNCCDIAYAVDDHGHLIVVSALDNLVKGAAGQAVQCMNIALGLDEPAGLSDDQP